MNDPVPLISNSLKDAHDMALTAVVQVLRDQFETTVSKGASGGAVDGGLSQTAIGDVELEGIAGPSIEQLLEGGA